MKLRIVNKRRFITVLSTLALVIYFVVCSLNNKVSSNEIVTYKTVTVNSGDTLWSIAQNEQIENEYYKNSDIRKIIFDIKELNNLKTSNLTIRQNLKIPTKY